MKLLAANHVENDNDQGFIYEGHEKIREILTEYNDTLRGRCAICLENYIDEEQKAQTLKFSERQDLVRVDECFHKYHLKCLYRDWFMPRKVEKDEFGCDIVHKIPS